jgi:hypothetical protein
MYLPRIAFLSNPLFIRMSPILLIMTKTTTQSMSIP